MKKPFLTLFACVLGGVLVTGCATVDRSQLLISSGPQVDADRVDAYVVTLNNMRRLYYEMTGELEAKRIQETPDKFKPITDPAELTVARDMLFAYVDSRCDAYLDAIFWAARARTGVNRSNNAVGTATSAIVAATGGAPNVLGIIAGAFGLSGELFDTTFESVLYGLEPSSIRYLVDQANLAVRTGYDGKQVASEPALLQQVQDYIRQCTPAHLDFLVNQALKNANIVQVKSDSQANLLLMGGCQLKVNGTVIGKKGKVYSLGQDFSGESCGFKLKPNGVVDINGKDTNFGGLANWKDVPKAKPKAPAVAKAAKPADGDGSSGKETASTLESVRVGVE